MGQKNNKATRDGFGDALLKLGQSNPEVVALCADLTSSLRMSDFRDKYQERFFQVGVAEQNMAGIAAGLALSGKVPFMGSFSAFQPMRNLDQIRTSICMMNANVKIVSSHAGFSHAADGIQVEALEDVGIMRMLPNMTVLVPADYEQAYELTLQAAKLEGPVFIRLGRTKTEQLSTRKVKEENYKKVKIGKVQILREGKDLAIFCMGYTVRESLNAAKKLSSKGIEASVVNVHTVKPLDPEEILQTIKGVKGIISVEEHQRAGGMGSALAEVLAETDIKVRHKILGVDDVFGETAKTNTELLEKHGLTAEHILKEAQELIK